MRFNPLVFITVSGATCLPFVANGQDYFSNTEKTELPAPAEIGGQLAVDVMPGFRTGIGYPLRYAGVMRGSVRVEVGGRPLIEGQDYTIDYAGGVVYISAKVRADEAIRVAYRHDPKASTQSVSGTALPLMSLNFGALGDVQMLLGFNGVNRMADGSMMQSNMAGMKNSFSFGTNSLSGLFMVSSQSATSVRADSASPDQNAPKSGIEGTDRLILQKLQGSSRDLKFSLEYQDVGKRFAGFGMLQSAGYDAAFASQLEKEKGLQRFGFGMSAGNDKTLSVSNSLKVVQDGDSKIEWAGYNLKSSFFDGYFTSRNIGSGFTRFKDIAEADRDQLLKEKGINRQSLGGALKFAAGSSLKFDQTKIGDEHGSLLFKSFQYAGPVLNVSFSEQQFDKGFARARDLAENEREIWAKQRGLERTNFSLTTPDKFKGPKLAYSTLRVENGSQNLEASEFSVSHNGYAFEFWNRNAGRGFNRMGDLPQNDIDSMIVQTLKAYDPNAGLNPNDRGTMPREGGLNREFMRFTAAPKKGWGFSADQGAISDGQNGITRSTFGVVSPFFNFSYKSLAFDYGFQRTGDLLEMERNIYGQQIGFNRNDLAFDAKIGKSGALSLSNLNVNTESGGASRWLANYISPQLEVRAGFRSVDPNFSRVGSLVDPEAATLATLVGYSEHDISVKTNQIKNLKFEGLFYGADNPSRSEGHDRNRFLASYDLSKFTKVTLLSDVDHFDGADGPIFHDDLTSLQLDHNFGKFGAVTFRKESEKLEGSKANRPGRETSYLKYNTKLTKSFGVETEQARTQFADGGFENIQIYKADLNFTSKLSISASDIQIDRDGSKPDQTTYAYGVSYDFGHNLKIGYNHYRELNTAGLGKRNLRWDFSNGEWAGYDFGGFYDEKRIDNQRTTALANFHIANKKPFDFGPLSNILIKLGQDSQSDNQVIQKENKLADFSARLFGADIGLSYAHVMLQGEHIGADRTFKINLDPSGKKPLQVKLQYKVRTLPNDNNFIIRNYDISYKLNDKLKLTHKTNTLPEQVNGGAPLGSQLLPTGMRDYQLEYAQSKNTAYQFGFHELFNWQQRTLARKLELGATLFRSSGSPLRLKYGIENNEPAPGKRQTRAVYEIAFDQKPGPNQVLSFAIGTVNWSDLMPATGPSTNITFRVDYQLKF